MNNSKAFEEGLEAMKRGDTGLAIRMFESVVRADPTYAEVSGGGGRKGSENDGCKGNGGRVKEWGALDV